MTRPVWQKPLWLEGMYQSLTYGAGRGLASETRDAAILVETRALARKLFSASTIQEIAPRVAREGGVLTLPEVRTLLWLTSDPARDPAADGSSLVVLWFHDGANLRPSELLDRLRPELRWEELAEDWRF